MTDIETLNKLALEQRIKFLEQENAALRERATILTRRIDDTIAVRTEDGDLVCDTCSAMMIHDAQRGLYCPHCTVIP